MFVSVYLSVCPRAYLRNCSPISLFLCVLLSCVVALRYVMFHNIILHIITRIGNSGATMRILKVTQQGTAPDRGAESDSYDCVVCCFVQTVMTCRALKYGSFLPVLGAILDDCDCDSSNNDA